jgi:hypothetical protein
MKVQKRTQLEGAIRIFGWHINLGESGPDALDEFLVAAFDSVCRVESRPIGIDGILPGGDEFPKTRGWKER